MIETLAVSGQSHARAAIAAINRRYQRIGQEITEVERRRPFVVEFLGSPKAGKTTVRDIVARLAEKNGLKVFSPLEGASLPTTKVLRENLPAFNAWTGTYALQTLITTCIPAGQYDVVLFDRGLMDAICWFQALWRRRYISESSAGDIIRFFSMRDWLRFVDAAFIFTCSPAVSAARDEKLHLARGGRLATSAPLLETLLSIYADEGTFVKLPLRSGVFCRVDTSPESPGIRDAGLAIADRIATLIEDALNPNFLTIAAESVQFEGYLPLREAPVEDWYRKRELRRKKVVESDVGRKQLVSYSVIRVRDKIFRVHRTGGGNRPELQSRLSLGVGGHVEQCDENGSFDLPSILVSCLRRELDEELQYDGEPSIELVGFINDESIEAGKFHIAAIHLVTFPEGRVRVRPGIGGEEFGEKSWGLVDKGRIFEEIDKFDPWSRHIIANVLGGPEFKRTGSGVLWTEM